MTLFNILIYGSGAIAIALLLLRMFLRKRRERRAVEAAQAARTAARSETGNNPDQTPFPARIADAPAGPATRSAVAAPMIEAAAVEARATRTAGFEPPVYTAMHGATAPVKAAGQPSLFKTLGKKHSSTDDALPVIEADETPLANSEDYVFGALTPALASLLPDSEARRAQAKQELKNAGYYQPYALQNLAAVRYLAIMIPLLCLGGLLVIAPPAAEKYIIGAIVFVPLMGWAMPRLYVKSKAAERTSQIEKAMPDMLDMLNMCVSQGMTVPAALKRVSQDLPNVHPALYKELQIVTEQAQIGTLQHALENFNTRIDVPEVHSFTSLLIQTEHMGTSVSAALADYSDNMRESLKQRADEKGNQAAFKLLFPTVLCLMPAVYMFLLGPSTIELSNFFQRDALNLRQANAIIQQTGRQSPAPRAR